MLISALRRSASVLSYSEFCQKFGNKIVILYLLVYFSTVAVPKNHPGYRVYKIF